MTRPPPTSTLFPYTTLFRSLLEAVREHWAAMFGWLGAALIVDALDGPMARRLDVARLQPNVSGDVLDLRSEEHTSELQSRENLVCRLLLEKKNTSSR